MPIFELQGIEKVYQDGETVTPALRGVGFSIDEGEFVAIMGPSGSGKSTTLHIMGFLDFPTKGIFKYKGRPYTEFSEKEIAYIRNQEMGFVFQTFNLLPRTSVFTNVQLPLLYSSVPESEWKERVLKAIESVGLSHRIYHETSQLSVGERQRVAIARALINSPSVIFADEPTGNLDSLSGRAVMGILQRLNEEKGHTIVLITHETYTAQHAQRILFIKDGKVESDSRVEERVQARDFTK